MFREESLREMSVIYAKSDIFRSVAEVLTVPVNMKGVMGAGLALEFKQRFPGLLEKYRNAIEKRHLQLGRPVLVTDFRWSHKILLFATKDHWSNPCQLEWISDGLDSLIERTEGKVYYHGLAMPQLGCGLGQMKWETEVKPEIFSRAADLSRAFETIYLYGYEQAQRYGTGAKRSI